MNDRQFQLGTTAESLRRAFDESFAVAPETGRGEMVDFLAIRVDSGRYALRVLDLAALAGRRRIVPLPSPDPALAGLAGAQGRLVPVYRLGVLLGSGGGDEELTWLAVCGKEEPVGLAFAAVEGYLRVARAELYASDSGRQQFVHEALRAAGEVRYVLDVASILASIRERAGVTASVSGR